MAENEEPSAEVGGEVEQAEKQKLAETVREFLGELKRLASRAYELARIEPDFIYVADDLDAVAREVRAILYDLEL